MYTMNQSGDIFNSAGRGLIGMTVGGDKDDEELQGFYDKRRNIKFPVKLMQVLDDPTYHNIISWTPDGLAFVILKPTILEKEVLPTAFDTGTSKFKSFLRKLYRWGFLKKFHQSDDYTYYHQAFQRGNLALCLTITRLPNNVKKQNSLLMNSIANKNAQLQLANSRGLPGQIVGPLSVMHSHLGKATTAKNLKNIVASSNEGAATLNVLEGRNQKASEGDELMKKVLLAAINDPGGARRTSSELPSTRSLVLSGGETDHLHSLAPGDQSSLLPSSSSPLLLQRLSRTAALQQLNAGGASSSFLATNNNHHNNINTILYNDAVLNALYFGENINYDLLSNKSRNTNNPTGASTHPYVAAAQQQQQQQQQQQPQLLGVNDDLLVLKAAYHNNHAQAARILQANNNMLSNVLINGSSTAASHPILGCPWSRFNPNHPSSLRMTAPSTNSNRTAATTMSNLSGSRTMIPNRAGTSYMGSNGEIYFLHE